MREEEGGGLAKLGLYGACTATGWRFGHDVAMLELPCGMRAGVARASKRVGGPMPEPVLRDVRRLYDGRATIVIASLHQPRGGGLHRESRGACWCHGSCGWDPIDDECHRGLPSLAVCSWRI